MKNILLILLLTLSSLLYGQSPYNNLGEYTDTLIIKEECYLYKTPQITNQTENLKIIPKDTILYSNCFYNNYYEVMYDDEYGYIFCLKVITPTRVKTIQKQFLPEEIIIDTIINDTITQNYDKEEEVYEIYEFNISKLIDPIYLCLYISSNMIIVPEKMPLIRIQDLMDKLILFENKIYFIS